MHTLIRSTADLATKVRNLQSGQTALENRVRNIEFASGVNRTDEFADRVRAVEISRDELVWASREELERKSLDMAQTIVQLQKNLAIVKDELQVFRDEKWDHKPDEWAEAEGKRAEVYQKE